MIIWLLYKVVKSYLVLAFCTLPTRIARNIPSFIEIVCIVNFIKHSAKNVLNVYQSFKDFNEDSS